jgi:branched-chain amino acid transport system permease protein
MTFKRWLPTFLAFPLGGLLAIETIGSFRGPLTGAAGGLLAGAVGTAVAVPVLRTQGIYLALATFALGQVISTLFLNLEAVGAAAGYPVTAYAPAGAVIAAAAGVTALMIVLAQTRFALYLTAIKSDAVVADLMGVPVRALQIAAFAIGAAVAGFGGGFYAHHFSFVEAQHFGVLLSVHTVLYVLLGGTQTVYGPILGAAVFTLLPELLRGSEQWRFVIFAGFIIAFMAVRPEGLLTASALRRALALGRRPAEAQS